MSGTVVHSESEDSNDSDYELIKFLKSQKDTKGSVAKFKVTRKRLKSKAQASNPDLFGDGGREALCHVCKMIRLSSLQGRGHKLPGSFESLHRSAATCAVCNLILTSLRRKHTGLDDKLTESSVMQLEVTYGNEGVSDYKTTRRPSPRVHLNEAFHLTMSREPEGVIYIKALIKSRFGDKHYLDIQSTTRIFTNRDDISQRYNIPMDLRPKGDEKFGLMEKWLKEDPTPLVSPYSYDSNIGSGASAVCPSRLIYLGCSPDLRGRKLKLVTLQEASSLSTKEEVRSPRYVTLSHRWGSSHHFITTQANLNSRYQGFTFEDLPQTYQDAAVVCARLGYQFLWIDAVCIVQDDPIEWLKESEMMGDIYRFGSFTIATHCSEDDSQGFLRDAFRKRGSAKLDQTKYPSTFMRATADLELDVTKSPLSKRGWVLQERFLSTRIIHFTIGMIYWETSRCTKSEDGLLESASQGINTNINGEIPGPSDKIVSLPLSLRTLQQFHLQASVRFSNFSKLLETSDFDELNSATTSETASLRSPVEWYHLVEMYSTCSLTQAKDRLIAISGIAKFLQRQREIPYLAGIWQDSLAIGLWWLHVGSHSPDPPVQRASSWSWASREGPIQFPLADERLKFRVNCEFLAVDNANPSWLNGQGGLRIRTQVFNLTDRVILDGAYTSIFQESLPLWESGIEGLWTEDDPSLRLFNVSNARSLQLSRGIDQVSSSSTEYKSKSWCVLDSPSYHGFTRRYTTGLNGDAFLIASIAVFHRKSPAPSADREARPDEDIHLVLVLTASSQSYRWDGSYRRIGVGVIGSRFLHTLTRSSRMLHGSLLPPIPYVKRVITIV